MNKSSEPKEEKQNQDNKQHYNTFILNNLLRKSINYEFEHHLPFYFGFKFSSIVYQNLKFFHIILGL